MNLDAITIAAFMKDFEESNKKSFKEIGESLKEIMASIQKQERVISSMMGSYSNILRKHYTKNLSLSFKNLTHSLSTKNPSSFQNHFHYLPLLKLLKSP